MDSIFVAPPSRRQIILSPSVISRIFNEFKFRTLSPSSSKNLIFKTILNTAFGTNIILSERNSDTSMSWFINPNIIELLQPLEFAFQNVPKIDFTVFEPIDAIEDE